MTSVVQWGVLVLALGLVVVWAWDVLELRRTRAVFELLLASSDGQRADDLHALAVAEPRLVSVGAS